VKSYLALCFFGAVALSSVSFAEEGPFGLIPTELHEGVFEFRPSSDSVSRYDYDSGRLTLKRTGPDADGKASLSGVGEVRRFIVERTPTTIKRRLLVGVTCPGGDAGQSENGAVLVSAIRGIGASTAEQIARDGRFFQKKPRNWEEFRKEIFKIQDLLEVPIIEEVLGSEKHGRENARRLGYLSGRGCREVAEDREFTDYPLTRRFDKMISRRIDVNLTGAPLFEGEMEEFKFQLNMSSDGEMEVILTPPSRYNSYKRTKKTQLQNATEFELLGTRNSATTP
jgi:hypothetical protein